MPTENTNLFYRQYGTTGTPIIMLHGILSMSDNWVHIARDLAELNHSIFIPDLPNHGQSPHIKELTYKSLSKIIHNFAFKNKINNPVIIGHSWGGKIAMQYAHDYPDSLSHLIIIDISPKSYASDSNKDKNLETLKKLENLDLNIFKTRQDITLFLEEYTKSTILKSIIQKNIRRTKQGNFQLKVNPTSLIQNFNNIVANTSTDHKFLKPTLFLKGEKSDYITTADIATIKELYPNVTIKTIENARHSIHADNPNQLFQTIKNFLAS